MASKVKSVGMAILKGAITSLVSETVRRVLCYSSGMTDGPDIALAATLLGEPARANMMLALMAGEALTATELAKVAGILPSTASAHLGRLIEAGLVTVERQGRHRYHRIASADVAEGIEALSVMAERVGHTRFRPGPRDPALRFARRCYDHIAGDVGTLMYEAMLDGGLLSMRADGPVLTVKGRDRFLAEGIDTAALEAGARPMCRACLDWSTRRYHLAGKLGGALLAHAMAQGWSRSVHGNRVLSFTPAGLDRLQRPFFGRRPGFSR